MHRAVAEFMVAEHAAAPGPFSTRKATGYSASSAGGFSPGGKV